MGIEAPARLEREYINTTEGIGMACLYGLNSGAVKTAHNAEKKPTLSKQRKERLRLVNVCIPLWAWVDKREMDNVGKMCSKKRGNRKGLPASLLALVQSNTVCITLSCIHHSIALHSILDTGWSDSRICTCIPLNPCTSKYIHSLSNSRRLTVMKDAIS